MKPLAVSKWSCDREPWQFVSPGWAGNLPKSLIAFSLTPAMMNSRAVLALKVCVYHIRQHVCKWELWMFFFYFCAFCTGISHSDRSEVSPFISSFFFFLWESTDLKFNQNTSLATKKIKPQSVGESQATLQHLTASLPNAIIAHPNTDD